MPTITCAMCGKVFNDSHATRRFCSRMCYGEWRSQTLRGSDNPAWAGGPVTIICKQCVGTFNVERGKRETARFCCRECQRAWRAEHIKGEAHPSWQGGPVTLVCAECGNEFQRPQCHAGRSKHVFCSRQCSGKWFARHRTGPNNPMWRGGKLRHDGYRFPHSLSVAIRKRDGGVCQSCGTTKQLGVHHIIPFKDGGSNDPENLTTLCRSCHTKLHWVLKRERI